MTLLNAALYCIRRGWAVCPCNGKVTMYDGGYKNATTDEEQVRAWWTKTPNANPGFVPGKSANTVVDIDTGLTGEESLRAFMRERNIPMTFAVRSGSRPAFKVHLYFQGCGGESFNGWTDGEYGGDLRATWGHVMAPGSIHPESGEPYTVLWDVPLAPVPDWVRSLKAHRKERVVDPTAPITEWRNDAMIRILGKMRADGADDEMIRAFAMRTNETRIQPPLDEDELERIISNACKYPLGNLDPVPVLGPAVQPEAAKLPERMRPVYPVSAWDGTVVAEFAKLCGHDNNVPLKMYAESFRCVLGAVVGDRLSCPGVDGALPRTYTVIVAPKGKGKGTCIRRAVRFFNQTWASARLSFNPGLLSGERDFEWKPKGIGAWMAAASSVPGMARLCKDLESTSKSKPHLTWGNTLPRVLSVHEEMKTFLSTLFIEGGVGSGMEGVVCQLWDDVVFHGTATGTREAAYGEIMFSMLCGVTEQDWFDLLSRGNAVGGGLMSRFNIIGTEGNYENVSKLHPPDFTALQETFLPRVIQLEDAHARIMPTEAAERIISEWADDLPEGSERMNVHVWRSALLLAWLRHEESISAQTATDAVSLGQYQVASHDFYRTKSADTANARVQARLLRALEMKGPLSKRDLQRYTNAHRDGTELWTRALDGLLRDRAIGKSEDGAYYLAD